MQKLMKYTTIYCVLFTAISMTFILYYAANKVIVVADVAQDEVVRNSEDAVSDAASDNVIAIDRLKQNTNYFCIPLPEEVNAEEVFIENHYMDKELWISIRPENGMKSIGYYRDNAVHGNCEEVLEGHYEEDEAHVCLRFLLTGVYEYRSVFENQMLCVEFISPKEVYDRIVVIDPAYGADDHGGQNAELLGKDITLSIAQKLKDKLDTTDIKVYYTRMDDTNPTNDKRVILADETKADMLIRIESSASDNSKNYGTEAVYNSRYFIPGFGSVELADILEREVVTAISGKANGLINATAEDEVIVKATVPAASIKVGYLTNGQEAILLQREDYIDRIAEGIYNSVMKAYTQKENLE